MQTVNDDPSDRAVFRHPSDSSWLFPSISDSMKGRAFFCSPELGALWARGARSRWKWPADTACPFCLQVFGDKDEDGFYRGEGGGRWGYIPCNMVAEMAVDSPAGTQQLLQRGYLSPEVLSEGSGMTCSCPSPTTPTPVPTQHPPTPSNLDIGSGQGTWLIQGVAEYWDPQRLWPSWPQ